MSNLAEKLDETTNEKKRLREILDWMQSNYKGDMEKITKDAIEYARKRQYIFGTLWNEIGERTLKIYFNERMRFDRQAAFIEFGKNEDGEGQFATLMNAQQLFETPSPRSVYVMWYNLPDGTAVSLGDMNKSQCDMVAENYRKRERQNRKYAIVFEKISHKLYNKKVKEVFTENELEMLFAVQTMKAKEYPLLDE